MFNKIDKEKFSKAAALLLVMSILILALSIITSDTDTRKQIIDGDGGSEEKLCSILEEIDGVGYVDVMMEYDSDEQVKGVIVIAEGGENPVVVNNITNGVATLYDIPVSSVIVFERNKSEMKGEMS